MEERSLHIVIVGHVDHGKSTLVGRLLYDTGSLAPEKYEEIKAASGGEGGSVEFAYVMDHLEEERKRGITIDVAHTFFQTAKRRYVIIDAPGHKEFLKNMITGSSQAEAALLLVDITQGVREQTRRHCCILGLLGIDQVAVLVNKMDVVNYSEEAFDSVKGDIESALSGVGVNPSYIIPVSAIKGDNVADRSPNLGWFKGPTVLEALDSFSSLGMEDKALRFPVQDIYDMDGTSVIVGRVESGSIHRGAEVRVFPEGRTARIREIKKFMADDIEEAATGECIGVCVEDGVPERGDVLADGATPTRSGSIRANIFWMAGRAWHPEMELVWKGTTQEARARIERILKRFDPASIEVIEKDAEEILPAEVAEVEIRLEKEVVVDRFTEIPEMGRFVLEHLGEPVAGGIII